MHRERNNGHAIVQQYVDNCKTLSGHVSTLALILCLPASAAVAQLPDAPPQVLDAWVGKHPEQMIGGRTFFSALGTTNHVMDFHDRPPGQESNSTPKIFGTIKRTQVSNTLGGFDPMYLVPMCRVGECSDPDKAATRLVSYLYMDEGSIKLVIAEHHIPWGSGMKHCRWSLKPGNRMREEFSSKCFYGKAAPKAVNSQNIIQINTTYRKSQALAYAEKLERNPLPKWDTSCLPRITIYSLSADPC